MKFAKCDFHIVTLAYECFNLLLNFQFFDI